MTLNQVPSVGQLHWPTLKVLREFDRPTPIVAVTAGVIREVGLTPDLAAVVHGSGPKPKIQYRVEWALSHLKRIGLADNPQRGLWQATEAGLESSEGSVAERWSDEMRQIRGSTGNRAWLVRPGPDGQSLVDRWLQEGFISLAGAHLDVLPAGAAKKDVQVAVEECYEHVEYPQRRALTEDYYAFLTLMSEGDVVLARHDDRAWVGQITSDPDFADEVPRLRRLVDWISKEVTVDTLPSEAAALPGSPRLVTDLTAIHDSLAALLDDEPTQPEAVVTLPRATSELASSVYMGTEAGVGWLNDYIDLLETRRQVIVYGPPGTGKTFVARKIARHVAGAEERMTVVQFHPSYAYEDFFEGLRPVTTDGQVTYEVVPGPLRTLASAAADDPTHPYVLIIDEINRADIAKVFGELYYLLEYRGERITLQYSSPDKPFGLPKNLYLIGTMNTADRSIAMVDAAIRRRFPFIEMHPSEEPVARVLPSYLAAVSGTSERAELLTELNSQLTGKLREFQIGPSYLMRAEAATEAGLGRIWRYDILPLLEEQLYGTHTREQVHANFGLDAIRKMVALKHRQVLQSEPSAEQLET
ncbi:MAG: AAA family ATPase [Propionibacteriaceae bacterium]|jgi:5-methylcytosine-specific restriction protein B|nr:AAA family ATPase [Propionibacteriaceae bacterium]